eukprot:COSAG04_NODE_268_length_18517_cov_9.260940_18_plen_104_part_00
MASAESNSDWISSMVICGASGSLIGSTSERRVVALATVLVTAASRQPASVAPETIAPVYSMPVPGGRSDSIAAQAACPSIRPLRSAACPHDHCSEPTQILTKC